MTKDELILEIKKRNNSSHITTAQGFNQTLFYLNDEEYFKSYVKKVRNGDIANAQIWPGPGDTKALGHYVCSDYTDSIFILVETILFSRARNYAVNALVNVVTKVTKLKELLPLIRLLNHREERSSSTEISDLGFQVLMNSKNTRINKFLYNYVNAKYSAINHVSFGQVATILPNLKYDQKLINILLDHLKVCTNERTILSILNALNGEHVKVDDSYLEIIKGIIKDDFNNVSIPNAKHKLVSGAFSILANNCDEKIYPFLIEELSKQDINDCVHDVIKRMHDRGVLV